MRVHVSEYGVYESTFEYRKQVRIGCIYVGRAHYLGIPRNDHSVLSHSQVW